MKKPKLYISGHSLHGFILSGIFAMVVAAVEAWMLRASCPCSNGVAMRNREATILGRKLGMTGVAAVDLCRNDAMETAL